MANERTGQARPDILIPRTELYPEKELVIAHSLRAVHAAAISASDNILRLVGPVPEPKKMDPQVKFEREEIIDDSATDHLILAMQSAPFKFIGIDAEGAKEEQEGKAGKAMKLAIGTYGTGDEMVIFVVDVVEGTTSATHGWPDAWSIMAVAPVGGITPLPEDEGKKIQYMQKLFAPAAFKNNIAIDKPTKDNLQSIVDEAQIRPSDITVAIMDPSTRPANKIMVEMAQQFGAEVKTFSAGDFAWCLRAINSTKENPIIAMGRGGAEEGSIAAVAARAIGATCQLRAIAHKDKNTDLESIDRGRIWPVEEFIPAKPEDLITFGAAITDSTHFNQLKAIRRNPSIYEIDTLVVDASGFNFRTDEVAA